MFQGSKLAIQACLIEWSLALDMRSFTRTMAASGAKRTRGRNLQCYLTILVVSGTPSLAAPLWALALLSERSESQALQIVVAADVQGTDRLRDMILK